MAAAVEIIAFFFLQRLVEADFNGRKEARTERIMDAFLNVYAVELLSKFTIAPINFSDMMTFRGRMSTMVAAIVGCSGGAVDCDVKSVALVVAACRRRRRS